MPRKRRYGFATFIVSCVFSASLITFVLWNERRIIEQRQRGVKYRLGQIQQEQNMAEYEMQRKRAGEEESGGR
jgi:hypothetical protein